MSFFQSLYQDRGPAQSQQQAGPEMVPLASPGVPQNLETSPAEAFPPKISPSQSSTQSMGNKVIGENETPTEIQTFGPEATAHLDQAISKKTPTVQTAKLHKQSLIQERSIIDQVVEELPISTEQPSAQDQLAFPSPEIAHQPSNLVEDIQKTEHPPVAFESRSEPSLNPEISPKIEETKSSLTELAQVETSAVPLSPLNEIPSNESAALPPASVTPESTQLEAPTQAQAVKQSSSKRPAQAQAIKGSLSERPATPPAQPRPATELPSPLRPTRPTQVSPPAKTKVVKAPEVRIGQIDITILPPPSPHKSSAGARPTNAAPWFTKTL